MTHIFVDWTSRVLGCDKLSGALLLEAPALHLSQDVLLLVELERHLGALLALLDARRLVVRHSCTTATQQDHKAVISHLLMTVKPPNEKSQR